VIILIHVIASPTIYAIVKDLDMNLEDMIVDPPVKHTDDIVPVGRYPTTKMHLRKPIVTYLIMKRVSYFLRMPLQTPMVIKKKLIVIQRVRSLIIKHLRVRQFFFFSFSIMIKCYTDYDDREKSHSRGPSNEKINPCVHHDEGVTSSVNEFPETYG
jgi:hypothetical protein